MLSIGKIRLDWLCYSFELCAVDSVSSDLIKALFLYVLEKKCKRKLRA